MLVTIDCFVGRKERMWQSTASGKLLILSSITWNQGIGIPAMVKRSRLMLRETMIARGSQRDRDRERAQARTGAKGKQKDDGLTPEQRRERDAKALQEKAAKKAAQGAGGNNAAGSKK
ncbi:hypothetical protein JHK85_023966 [Glycine max]|nr:hypothetical protein JHK85_023966 [Glycine max]